MWNWRHRMHRYTSIRSIRFPLARIEPCFLMELLNSAASLYDGKAFLDSQVK